MYNKVITYMITIPTYTLAGYVTLAHMFVTLPIKKVQTGIHNP
jgi:hypothetical protein